MEQNEVPMEPKKYFKKYLHKEEEKFPREKKGNFLGEQCTFFRDGPKFPGKKGNFLGEQCIFPKERLEFLGE